MRKKLVIGVRIFDFKKEALSHYRKILNSYDYGEEINNVDFEDVFNLIKFQNNSVDRIGIGIRAIKVVKVRYNTKCFQLIREDDSKEVISYTKCINGNFSPLTKFSRTCRNVIDDDLRLVKLSYFKKYSKKGRVQCQESGERCKWEDLNVDHRQPNTFSMIVDRFIEINDININSIEYNKIMDAVYEFKEKSLADMFKNYH